MSSVETFNDVFGGQAVQEDTSIEALVSKGKQSVLESDSLKQRILDAVLSKVPGSLKAYIDKDSIKVTLSKHVSSARMNFLIPGMTKIFLVSQVYMDSSPRGFKEPSETWRYFFHKVISHETMGDADCMEQALFLATEEYKKGQQNENN
jgi:hypothetical protein